MQSQDIVSARRPLALDIGLISIGYLAIGLVALLPRILGLGGFVTVDEQAFWMPRSEAFLRAVQSGDFPATAISTHPGVTTMWLGSAGIILRRALLDWGVLRSDAFPTVLAFFRLPVVLAHTGGILLGYALLRRMLPATVAVLAALLWAADPFVIAYSRVLHVDALAGTFLTVSLLAACAYWFHGRRPGLLILSGISAGLAILSKSPALALVPMVGLIALLAIVRTDDGRWTIDDERSTPRSSIVYRLSSIVLPLLAWGAVCLATAVALWPALWTGPFRAIEQIRVGVVGEGAEPHMQGNFFLGKENDAPGLLFYPVALALRTTPWTLLGLLLLPIVWRRARDLAPTRRDLAALAAFAIVFIVAMSLFPKKFNRYLLPAFPAIDILAAAGLMGIVDYRPALSLVEGLQIANFRWDPSKIKNRLSQMSAALGGVIAVAALVNVGYWHPYEIAAYNQALGGARAGAYAFLTGWGEGLEQAAAWLNEQPDITGVRVASTQPWVLQPYLRDGAQAVAPGAQLPDRTGYVVVYVRSAQAEIWPPFDQFYGRAVPLHVVQIHGVDYAWIYQAPPALARPRPADFGEQIHLRGLTLEGAARRGQPLALKLFWEPRAAPPADYMLFAHLIAADGTRVAQVDLPYPTSGWRAGRYVTTELPLTVPPDAPAGSYKLAIGLYDPRTGQRLALDSDAALDPAIDGPDALLLTELALP